MISVPSHLGIVIMSVCSSVRFSRWHREKRTDEQTTRANAKQARVRRFSRDYNCSMRFWNKFHRSVHLCVFLAPMVSVDQVARKSTCCVMLQDLLCESVPCDNDNDNDDNDDDDDNNNDDNNNNDDDDNNKRQPLDRT